MQNQQQDDSLFRGLNFLSSLQADMMKQAFSVQKQLLQTASSSQKPSDVS